MFFCFFSFFSMISSNASGNGVFFFSAMQGHELMVFFGEQLPGDPRHAAAGSFPFGGEPKCFFWSCLFGCFFCYYYFGLYLKTL